ncbi:hypothetical protein GYMLUDRAFT_64805 [Collybiopsis luxurians FD-317 M1]|uniref:Uncharacterized protein n=1 Tax=Collybiopsis luxurians FD-317 M1 TaxID=944289 RepID=A0A0D0C9T1_9AGAR|nr:hypothetical protein GYMLUDRAFT_64805 [Collybiopsis luxurians FD-317 M1]
MDMVPSSPKFYSSNLRGDIILLSTLLSHKQFEESQPKARNREHRPLALLHNIATVLTTGTIDSPAASTVIAVFSKISEDLMVSKLVIAQNMGPTGEGKGLPFSSSFTVSPIVCDTGSRKQALKNWNTIPSNFSAETHIQDTMNILKYISDAPDSEILELLPLLFHRRAILKFIWRIQNFTTHWIVLPFQLMMDHIDVILQHSDLAGDFIIPLGPAQVAVISRYGLVCEKLPTLNEFVPQDFHDSLYRISLTYENLAIWINIFINLWQMLVQATLIPKTSPSPPPDNSPPLPAYCPREDQPGCQELIVICLYISILYELQPLLKHLLLHPHITLLRALQNAEFNVRKAKSDGQSSRVILLTEVESEYLHEQDELHTDHVLHTLGTVLAWHTSSIALYHHRHSFSSPSIRFHQLHCGKMSVFHFSNEECRSVLKAVALKREWTEKEVSQLSKRARYLTIHAETALMGWIMSEQSSDSMDPDSIATGKKCCALCWDMHELSETELEDPIQFHLPGTHATFHPWAPPFGVPEAILVKL